MNRGGDIARAAFDNSMTFFAAFVGNGAADMVLATNAQYPKIANLGLTCTRTSIGLYVLTLSDTTPQILKSEVELIGTTQLDGKFVVAFNPVTKVGQVNIFSVAGALADPAAADLVVFAFYGRNSTS